MFNFLNIRQLTFNLIYIPVVMKSPFKVKINCIESLKKEGHPVIIVTVHEAEAIAYVQGARHHNLEKAICDSELRKITKKFFPGIKVIHTPVLPNFFPKARFIIASQHIQECADQLYDLGEDFYSPLELLKTSI